MAERHTNGQTPELVTFIYQLYLPREWGDKFL